jgi:two-component system, LytTR family, sensor kinase
MAFKKLFARQYLIHYALWLLVTATLALDVIWLFPEKKETFFLYIFGKTAVMLALVYSTLLYFFPVFYKRKKYIACFTILFFLAIWAAFINTHIEQHLWPTHRFESAKVHRVVLLKQFFMAARYILFAFFLKNSIDYYQQKEILKKTELEKIRAEMDLLKTQVNPHFLFNTLNNLYALILEKSDKSGEAVLKLADIMKYTLTEGTADKTLLKKETTLLYNYVELEKLRHNDAVIQYEVEGEVDNHYITPLLLLPLVENAFKYGLNAVSSNGFVNIQIKASKEGLQMHIENSRPPLHNTAAIASLGMGIDNVKKRLELLYSGKYQLVIKESPNRFIVNLQLLLA